MSIPWVAGTMAGMKEHFPYAYGRNSMITVGSHMGPTGFLTPH
jgi:hypothetical protein